MASHGPAYEYGAPPVHFDPKWFLVPESETELAVAILRAEVSRLKRKVNRLIRKNRALRDRP